MRLRTLLPAGGYEGTTQKGKRCEAKDVYENGYCEHHGGEGKSLQARRLDLASEDAKTKSARLAKRLAKWERRNPALRQVTEEIRAKQHARRKNQI